MYIKQAVHNIQMEIWNDLLKSCHIWKVIVSNKNNICIYVLCCNKVNGKLYSWWEMWVTSCRMMCSWMQMSLTLQSACWRAQCQQNWPAHYRLQKILIFVLDKNKLEMKSVLWGKWFSATRVRSQMYLKSLLSKCTKFVIFSHIDDGD